MIEYIKKRLFESIYTTRKLNRGTNDFPFDRYVDGSIHGSSMGGMELSVVTMASDLGRSDDAELALKSVDKAIVALSDEVDYWAPLVNAAKIRKYAKTRNLQELQPSTRQIVESKMREAAYNEKEADTLLSEAVLHARCAVNSRIVEVRAAKPAQVFEQVLAQLCDVVFEKADYIGAPVTSDSDIRSTLAGNVQAGLAGMDAGNTRALKEVEDYLKVQHQRHLDTAMGDIQRRYQQKPYGWREVDIANVVAQLVVEQRAQVLFGGQTVQANDSRMVSLLRKDADKAQVRLRVRMSDRLLRATGELMRGLFDLKTVPSNEDKLVAELKERLEGLREVCVAMARDYYTGVKPAYPYPGEDECEKMRSEVVDVLKDQSDSEAFLTTFTKHEDRLLDAKEDFDKVVEFFESNQRTAFDHAKDFLSRTEGIEYASDDIPNAVENVAKVREILKDPKPYGRIKDLQPLMAPVEEDIKSTWAFAATSSCVVSKTTCRICGSRPRAKKVLSSRPRMPSRTPTPGMSRSRTAPMASRASTSLTPSRQTGKTGSLLQPTRYTTPWMRPACEWTTSAAPPRSRVRVRWSRRSPTRAPHRLRPCPRLSPNARSRPCAAPIWPSRVASCPQRTWSATWTTCALALCRSSLQTTRFVSTNSRSYRCQSEHRWFMAFRKAHQP